MKYFNYYRCITIIYCLTFSILIVSDVKIEGTLVEDLEESLQQENPKIELILEDEKLKQEICDIVSAFYKNIIDLSALYFSGLVDSDKLWDQAITLTYKDLFKILKLFSWYIPATLKNQKNSMFTKIKKSVFVISFILVFWYGSKEIMQGRKKNKELLLHDELNESRADFISYYARQRPRE